MLWEGNFKYTSHCMNVVRCKNIFLDANEICMIEFLYPRYSITLMDVRKAAFFR